MDNLEILTSWRHKMAASIQFLLP